MSSKKLFGLLHKIALFAIVFGSLALVAKIANYSFTQEICSTNGKVINIKVVTSKSQQLSVNFALEQTVSQSSNPQNIAMHLEHCPFCGGQFSAATLPASNVFIIVQLAVSELLAAKYAVPVFASHTYVIPPAQAPPSLSSI